MQNIKNKILISFQKSIKINISKKKDKWKSAKTHKIATFLPLEKKKETCQDFFEEMRLQRIRRGWESRPTESTERNQTMMNKALEG